LQACLANDWKHICLKPLELAVQWGLEACCSEQQVQYLRVQVRSICLIHQLHGAADFGSTGVFTDLNNLQGHQK